jgi:hypothetical protein
MGCGICYEFGFDVDNKISWPKETKYNAKESKG